MGNKPVIVATIVGNLNSEENDFKWASKKKNTNPIKSVFASKQTKVRQQKCNIFYK